MDKDDPRPLQLIREIELLQRRRRSDIIFTIGALLALVGIALMWTEAFGTALILSVAGFTIATIGSEYGK